MTQSTPKPLTAFESDSVESYRHFRDQMRNGPLYTVLEPSAFTDEQGKVNKHSGEDPFESMPTYSARYKKAKRTLPDLSHLFYGEDSPENNFVSLTLGRSPLLPKRAMVYARSKEV